MILLDNHVSWPAAQRARDGARSRACDAIVQLAMRVELLPLATPALLRLCAAEALPGAASAAHSPAAAWAHLARRCLDAERDTTEAAACAMGRPCGGSRVEQSLARMLAGNSLHATLLQLIGATRAEAGMPEEEEEKEEEEEEEVDEAQAVASAAMGHACGGSPAEQALAAMLAR
jgi:hypothetical protein